MSSNTTPHKASQARQEGFVLICVLWILAILTVVSLGFHKRTMLDLRAARYAMDYSKAKLRARGAVELGRAQLKNRTWINGRTANPTGNPHNLGEYWANPKNMLLEEGKYYDSETGESTATSAQEAKTQESCTFFIEDEAGKISIMKRDPQGQGRGLSSHQRDLLSNIKSLPKRAYDTISKSDGRGRSNTSNKNYERFYVIEEIQCIQKLEKDIEDEHWFGGEEGPPLKDILTWKNTRINVNTAPRAVLMCIPGLNEKLVDRIIALRPARESGGGSGKRIAFKSMQDLKTRLEIGDNGKVSETLTTYCCTTASNTFTIGGVATLRQGKIRACCKAVVENGRIVQWREEAFGS